MEKNSILAAAANRPRSRRNGKFPLNEQQAKEMVEVALAFLKGDVRIIDVQYALNHLPGKPLMHSHPYVALLHGLKRAYGEQRLVIK